MNFGFAHPWALALLLLIPAWWWYTRRTRPGSLTFSRASLLGRYAPRGAVFIARAPDWLRALAVAAAIIAVATPRTGASVVDVDVEGIAIMLVVDVSSSMLAEDFAPQNRLPWRSRRWRTSCAAVSTTASGSWRSPARH
jgi:Ca-activated chloride channel homolog